jgi:hypothetical protein
VAIDWLCVATHSQSYVAAVAMRRGRAWKE